ncbi:OmpH family outer membrane protein [Akkermansiaceae bacterium]|nr:OmpH family outer membrane protein [Akkermansiaceae bacterium]MDA7611682.1 OmpH family outer membrane protein [bacterium]MDA7538396.1 OmpH family outer membrane protein [Akkermansiaceae bacterium]MDA7651289.1 OmpH family outer membrane protein [Akkermansiaceae bacterium]MDA7672721.1 OmpH family outer membrane protein [Akkermansiaceae bacterium]
MNLRLTNSIFGLLLLFQFSLQGQESVVEYKAGIVDVQKVFKSSYKSKETQGDIDQERARIKKEDNETRAKLQVFKKKIQELYQQFQAEGISEEEVETLTIQRQSVTQHLQKLDQERAAFNNQANSRLDQQMKGKMGGILKEISELVNQHAEAENFTIVFEKAGTNTNQVTPLLYGKGLIDITAALMVELNKDRPDDK